MSHGAANHAPGRNPSLRRLRYAVGGFLALLLAVVLAHGLPECRTGRVVLGGLIAPDAVVRLDIVYTPVHGVGPVHKRIWNGPVGRTPILVPYNFRGDGEFYIEIDDPRAYETRVAHHVGIIWVESNTNYIFIGPHSIVSDSTGSSYFYRTNLSETWNGIVWFYRRMSDGLTCAI